MTNEQLTQEMYNLIELNVSDGHARAEMFDLLSDLEDRL